jgi:hypothetical protein
MKCECKGSGGNPCSGVNCKCFYCRIKTQIKIDRKTILKENKKKIPVLTDSTYAQPRILQDFFRFVETELKNYQTKDIEKKLKEEALVMYFFLKQQKIPPSSYVKMGSADRDPDCLVEFSNGETEAFEITLTKNHAAEKKLQEDMIQNGYHDTMILHPKDDEEKELQKNQLEKPIDNEIALFFESKRVRDAITKKTFKNEKYKKYDRNKTLLIHSMGNSSLYYALYDSQFAEVNIPNFEFSHPQIDKAFVVVGSYDRYSQTAQNIFTLPIKKT